MNNFNFIAPVYDRFVRLFFGNTLQESQNHFLSTIKASDKVLILGGGTGELLEVIPNCSSVYFVDLSDKMLEIARKRKTNNIVEFVHSDFLKHNFENDYDVIICPFFLDLFDTETLQKTILKIKKLLSPAGSLIITDFQKTNWNSLFLKMIHFGFRMIAAVQTRKLKDLPAEVENSGLIGLEKKEFYGKMVFSQIYLFPSERKSGCL